MPDDPSAAADHAPTPAPVIERPHRVPTNIRYDVVVATFVAVCALCVSAYTARMQRQQVRAMVWPILEYSTSNEPFINLCLANKGVGPAIIQRVVVRVDGQPMRDWRSVIQKLLGPERPRFSCSNMRSSVLSPGESTNIFVPYSLDGKQLTYDRTPDALSAKWNEARFRVTIEVWYRSTLGDCWMLSHGRDGDDATVEVSSCPPASPEDFQQ